MHKTLDSDTIAINRLLRDGFRVVLTMEDNMKTGDNPTIYVKLVTSKGKHLQKVVGQYEDRFDGFPSDLLLAQLLMVAGK